MRSGTQLGNVTQHQVSKNVNRGFLDRMESRCFGELGYHDLRNMPGVLLGHDL